MGMVMRKYLKSFVKLLPENTDTYTKSLLDFWNSLSTRMTIISGPPCEHRHSTNEIKLNLQHDFLRDLRLSGARERSIRD